MKMKNELKNTRTCRSKTHIGYPSRRSKRILRRIGVMKMIVISLLLNLEPDNAKIVQIEIEPIVIM
jgi:hypothetical protein